MTQMSSHLGGIFDSHCMSKTRSVTEVLFEFIPCQITYLQGGPTKTTFLRYHIFAATTDIITRFLLKCSEITAENNKRQFFKRVLNVLCKLARILYLVNVSASTL